MDMTSVLSLHVANSRIPNDILYPRSINEGLICAQHLIDDVACGALLYWKLWLCWFGIICTIRWLRHILFMRTRDVFRKADLLSFIRTSSLTFPHAADALLGPAGGWQVSEVLPTNGLLWGKLGIAGYGLVVSKGLLSGMRGWLRGWFWGVCWTIPSQWLTQRNLKWVRSRP